MKKPLLKTVGILLLICTGYVVGMNIGIFLQNRELQESGRTVVRMWTRPAYADVECTVEIPLSEIYSTEEMGALKDLALNSGYTLEQWESADFPQ